MTRAMRRLAFLSLALWLVTAPVRAEEPNAVRAKGIQALKDSQNNPHTIVEAARRAGGKLLVVDAIDERAAAFYRLHDFVALPARSDRLVMKMSTAAKALGVSWP